MDDKLHFIITSERGKTRSFSASKSKIKTICTISLMLLLVSITGINSTFENVGLRIKVAGLERDLGRNRILTQDIQAKAAKKEEEQKVYLQHALNELDQRSKVIESILDTVGVDIQVKEDSENNVGGPYASLPSDSFENLTFKVDHYLDTIQSVPLGSPVPGTITSRFGRRVDPFNKRMAFHSGLDIRSDSGTEIHAPADGKVIGRGYTRGEGNFLEIDHGNTFITRYFHMKKSLVKRGENVTRGQVIGLVGSTGRSTGPHLHYEIKYRDKVINPIKFVNVAKYVAIEEEQ